MSVKSEIQQKMSGEDGYVSQGYEGAIVFAGIVGLAALFGAGVLVGSLQEPKVANSEQVADIQGQLTNTFNPLYGLALNPNKDSFSFKTLSSSGPETCTGTYRLDPVNSASINGSVTCSYVVVRQ